MSASPTPCEMGEELESVAEELGLPHFRVPAPKSSAVHTAATVVHQSRRLHRPAPPGHNPTRQFTPTPAD